MNLRQKAPALAILLVAGWLRIYHLFQMDAAHEPFRLGGLFLLFSQQIAENGFQLPASIPYYSQGGIPFAYPPLAFYVEALFLKLFPQQEILLVNWLPPLVSILTLVLCYVWLQRTWRDRPWHVLAALFAYGFLPTAFANQVEAAGLAEAFGGLTLFGLFAAINSYQRSPGWKPALLTGASLGLCVLASPGSAVAGAMLGGLWGLEQVILLRNAPENRLRALLHTVCAALLGILLSAPYWLTTILVHGRGIFILPLLAQYDANPKKPYLPNLIDNLTSFHLTQDGWAFFWNGVVFLGLLWLVLRGRWQLPLAFLALFSIPRENAWLTALPASLLFAHGWMDFLAPVAPSPSTRRVRVLAFGVLAAVLGWAIIQSFELRQALVIDQQWKISAEQVQKLQENRDLIPPDAQVLVLGNDALLEWSPVLLQREVINTKFGLEWQPAELQQVFLLNQSLQHAQNWNDILQAVKKQGLQIPIYIVSTEKKALTALSRESAGLFTLKLETPALQIGILQAEP